MDTLAISKRLSQYWGDGSVDVVAAVDDQRGPVGTLVFLNSPTSEKWVPADNPDLSELKTAMSKIGLNVGAFSFQNYDVHGGQTGKPTKDQQLGIVSTDYAKPHQTDLALRSPDVAAQEIKTYKPSDVAGA